MPIEWQPIETAPKNAAGEFLGPTILIYYEADGLTWPAYWGPEKGSLVDGAWHVADDYGYEQPFSTPDVTHWAPMPEPPGAKHG